MRICTGCRALNDRQLGGGVFAVQAAPALKCASILHCLYTRLQHDKAAGRENQQLLKHRYCSLGPCRECKYPRSCFGHGMAADQSCRKSKMLQDELLRGGRLRHCRRHLSGFSRQPQRNQRHAALQVLAGLPALEGPGTRSPLRGALQRRLCCVCRLAPKHSLEDAEPQAPRDISPDYVGELVTRP